MMRKRLSLFVVFCVFGLSFKLLLSSPKVKATSQNTVRFNRDIRPILTDTCFLCHGPDKNSRKAGLRLDLREEATRKSRSGITPIVPGKPDESEIIRRIYSTDKYEVMPPQDVHKDLTAQQKELIRRWVSEGAEYEGHWAYQPITRPTVPAVSNQALIHNPIDAFIQSRLAATGLSPSKEADRRTLIRRVALDLTGIAPTTQEVNAFVRDKSPNAYEKLVDRLLRSERYAEKQTIHWLDAVRYADTAGFHGDNPYPTWPYRDYVLRSFHNNKPFDQFTREQLGGDLLPNATQEQLIASAYNRLNRVSAEGGVQPKEYLAKYGADRVRTTSIVWLGATMGCAECHDHKFDPILTKDFYAMKAFFADIEETGLVPDRGTKAWGSKLLMATPAQQQKLNELNDAVQNAEKQLDEKVAQASSERKLWEQRVLTDYEAGKLAWKFQIPIAVRTDNSATLTIYNDEYIEYNYGDDRLYLGKVKMPGNGLIVASGLNPDNETYTVTINPGAGEWSALGIQLVRDVDLPGNNIARGADKFVLTSVEAESSSGKPLKFSLATSDGQASDPDHPAMAVLDDNPKTGWATTYGMGRTPFLALQFTEKVRTDDNATITIKLRHDSDVRRATIGRFRIAMSSAEYSWPESNNPGAKELKPTLPFRPFVAHNGLLDEVWAALKTPEDKRKKEAQSLVLEQFKWSAPQLQPLYQQLARLKAERDLLEASIPKVLVTQTTTPSETRILPRGNWMDESGALLQPAVPEFLGRLDDPQRRATRLDLANWIVSKDNPLTARVFVNRLWRQFFGTGLTKSLDDLGSQGEWPKHPELLDWLASEFMTDWDMKRAIRTIVTSHTYRQSSLSNAELDARDPDNRLLARQSRYRVDAEIVRDIALATSGLLVEKFGGPSVKPKQPENYLAALNFPKRDYAASRGDELYRRSLYTHWQRTFLHPGLMTFDAPTREECTVNRVNSNTPLQSLVLLNDPNYTEAARSFAEMALAEGGRSVAAQIRWAFERAVSRPPSSEEMKVLLELHHRSRAEYLADPIAATRLLNIGESPANKRFGLSKLAAMTIVTRAILNLHETITRN